LPHPNEEGEFAVILVESASIKQFQFDSEPFRSATISMMTEC
jgi:hypothetical protein